MDMETKLEACGKHFGIGRNAGRKYMLQTAGSWTSYKCRFIGGRGGLIKNVLPLVLLPQVQHAESLCPDCDILLSRNRDEGSPAEMPKGSLEPKAQDLASM